MEPVERLDPIKVTGAIGDAFARYLRTTLRTNDPDINRALARAMTELTSPLIKGPIVQVSPRYQPGASVAQLVREGVLSAEWLRLDFGGEFDPQRPLYAHQEAAIRKAVADRRNIVVATGTGSGKTESFLVPILDELFRQRERGVLGPGVRALLLYPMNALANDQLRRLRRMLANVSFITFGRYTGETRERASDAEDHFKRSYPDEPRIFNELISRDEMQEAPPHILLTNYAMLEYLLLRPEDSTLFDPVDGLGWKFIVLDEVHTYDGAMGMEIGMLLRRLLDRVGRGPGEIRAVATSATAGGPDERDAIARFASDLFSLPFKWEERDPRRQDVIVSTVEPPALPPKGERVDIQAALSDRPAVTLERLLADPRVHQVVTSLNERPMALEAIGEHVFGQAETGLAAQLLERLGTEPHPATGAPVLRARYHTFVRSPESVDICLRRHGDGLPRVFLEPQRHCPECGQGAPVAELATCRRCSQWHLRGRVQERSGESYFVRAADLDERVRGICYIAPPPGFEENEEFSDDGDDERAVPESLDAEARDWPICLSCMRIGSSDSCECAEPNWQTLRSASRTKGGAFRCVNCNEPSSRAGPRRIRLGAHAPPAVVASVLFDCLPRGDRRPRFLSFSDSRQDAAFFAPYLERTYGRVARRRLIYETLRRHWNEVGAEGVRLDSLVRLMAPRAAELGFRDQRDDAVALRIRLQTWVIAELTAMDSRQSLSGVGLVTRRLVRPDGWTAPPALLREPWRLSEDEAWWLIEALLRTLIEAQAVALPQGVTTDDPIFSPRNKQVAVRLRGRASGSDIEVVSWLPSKDVATNGRLDFLVRVLGRTSPGMSVQEQRFHALTALEKLWEYLISGTKGQLPDYLSSSQHPLHGVVFKLDPQFWEFVPPQDLFQCERCGTIEHGSVRGICPSFRCRGRCVPLTEPPADNHYRVLYQQPPLGPLISEEHTAHWAPDAAARIQSRFVSERGDINVLSCSTTFELGVDVGELEAVFLRNVPPTPANYVQRAGRVGRRSGSASLVVTFAQLRPHDRQAFDRAEDWVAGRVPAPRVPARNEHIVRRHVHSVALSRFLRLLVGQTGGRWPRRAIQFFEETFPQGIEEKTPHDGWVEYLKSKDPDLKAELERIVPPELHEPLGIPTWAWAERLASADASESPLALARELYQADVEYFTTLKGQAAAAEKFKSANHYAEVLNTIRGEPLLGLLASRTVIPKYGFPVDVVPLHTNHLESELARSLELERDLKIAISEYAPGSEIVAAKHIWRSEGLKVLQGKKLPTRKYIVCRECNRIYKDSDNDAGKMGSSDHLGEGHLLRSEELIEPIYGFVSGMPSAKLGDDPPVRLHASRALFHLPGRRESDEEWRELLVHLGPTSLFGRFSRNGQLAVINDAGGRSFLICEHCGFADINVRSSKKSWNKKHKGLIGAQTCSSILRKLDLGHFFATDIAELYSPQWVYISFEEQQSVLAALLEGARRVLDVSENDLGGMVYRGTETPVFTLYDQVPGGAGLAREAFERIEDVVRKGVELCEGCSCGEHSSCYGCLRNYQNQREHEQLDRTIAAEMLSSLFMV
ncbi:MAG: DEAD/DEAH box helicase [Fimbriimonadales bacterium]|nr:MAG: DEAD/DEAH box helicase [Fimbriimonadales bacterium]